MNKLLLLIPLLLIAGCNSEPSGKLRHQLFVQCMELSAKMPRQANDDVSDIVSECSYQAYYMAISYMKSKEIPKE